MSFDHILPYIFDIPVGIIDDLFHNIYSPSKIVFLIFLFHACLKDNHVAIVNTSMDFGLHKSERVIPGSVRHLW